MNKVQPSHAARWMACPGSRAMESKHPQTEKSPGALEGDAAHWVASEAVRGRMPENTRNGEIITQEMIDGARMYAEHVERTLSGNLLGLRVEEQIPIPRVHPDCLGTPDCWAFENNAIYLWDYKFGHGFVEVYENWQLLTYAAGILDLIHPSLVDIDTLVIRFFIVQPRSYHPDGPVRGWTITKQLLDRYVTQLKYRAALTDELLAPCNPSPECKYCSARHSCPALQNAALSAVDVVYENTPHELDNTALGNELRALQRAAVMLNARITGLIEQAIGLIKHGQRVAHYHIEESAGRVQWNKSANEIIALGKLMQIDVAKPPEAITPKQAIDKGLSEDLVAKYSYRPRGAFKLVPDETKKIFNKED